MVAQDVRVSGILALVAAVLVWRPLRSPELKALMPKALDYIYRRLQKEFRGLPRTDSARDRIFKDRIFKDIKDSRKVLLI